jgi:hypothetical protein
MKFIVDSNYDVFITFGDFILRVITFDKSVSIKITCGAFAHHVVGRTSMEGSVYFTSHDILPQLVTGGEIHVFKCYLSGNPRYDDGICTTIFTLQTYVRYRWLPVPGHHMLIINDYMHQLPIY